MSVPIHLDEKVLRAKARLMFLLIQKGPDQSDVERMTYQALRHDPQVTAAWATQQRKAG